ncbi:MAG: PorT family protein, partial [Bacteroidetes bacterium]
MKSGYAWVVLLLLITSNLYSQERELYQTDHDVKPYYFGITLGFNIASFHTDLHPRFLQYDSVYVAKPVSSGGFQLGLLATARLTNRFELRFNPQLLFTQRNLFYKL